MTTSIARVCAFHSRRLLTRRRIVHPHPFLLASASVKAISGRAPNFRSVQVAARSNAIAEFTTDAERKRMPIERALKKHDQSFDSPKSSTSRAQRSSLIVDVVEDNGARAA